MAKVYNDDNQNASLKAADNPKIADTEPVKPGKLFAVKGLRNLNGVRMSLHPLTQKR